MKKNESLNNQHIPSWLKSYLKTSDLESIRQHIEHIEKKTQAELVPMIVHASIDLPLFRSFLLTLGLVCSLVIAPLIHSLLNWNSLLSTEVLVSGLILIFSLLALWASNNSLTLRIFFKKTRIHDLVFKRACSEFFENQLYRSENRTAVLFMYSVLERKAMIIADPNLHSIPQKFWQTAVDKMVTAAKKNQFATGFRDALEFTAEELQKSFPPLETNKNEFADTVIIKN